MFSNRSSWLPLPFVQPPPRGSSLPVALLPIDVRPSTLRCHRAGAQSPLCNTLGSCASAFCASAQLGLTLRHAPATKRSPPLPLSQPAVWALTCLRNRYLQTRTHHSCLLAHCARAAVMTLDRTCGRPASTTYPWRCLRVETPSQLRNERSLPASRRRTCFAGL